MDHETLKTISLLLTSKSNYIHNLGTVRAVVTNILGIEVFSLISIFLTCFDLVNAYMTYKS